MRDIDMRHRCEILIRDTDTRYRCEIPMRDTDTRYRFEIPILMRDNDVRYRCEIRAMRYEILIPALLPAFYLCSAGIAPALMTLAYLPIEE